MKTLNKKLKETGQVDFEPTQMVNKKTGEKRMINKMKFNGKDRPDKVVHFAETYDGGRTLCGNVVGKRTCVSVEPLEVTCPHCIIAGGKA